MKLNKLNKYKLNLKVKAFGKFSWDVLVTSAEVILALFFLLTAFEFWFNIMVKYPNLINQISKMFFIVLIGVVILVLNKVKNL